MAKPKGRFLSLGALQNISETAPPPSSNAPFAVVPPPEIKQPAESVAQPAAKAISSTTSAKRAKGQKPVPGGRARNPGYVTLTLYIKPELRKLLRFYLRDDEDLSELAEQFLLHFVESRREAGPSRLP